MHAAVEQPFTPIVASRPRWRRPLQWCAGGFLVVLLVLLLAGLVIARKLQPILRARLLQTFQERFHSPATLDDVHVHYNGQLQVEGRGLRVQSVLAGVPGDPQHPMLQVQEFHFHVGLWAALSHSPRIHHVRIRGVQLELPPAAAERGNAPETASEVDLEYAEIDDAHIRFASSAADRAPLQFDLPHLTFRGVSRSRPIQFHGVVDNGPPLGITETDGTIGPWNFDDPRLTPLQGTFAFRDKDMSSTRGLHGRLSLNGRYSGTVGNMHAEGTTEDPAFALDVSSHPVALRTRFAMTLQPAQNAVELEHLEGAFGKTVFVCNGEVIKDRAANSFRMDLQLQARAARVEDALILATHASPPLLRGALTLSGRLQMQAGPQSVSRKLTLQNATFTVTNATFSQTALQQTFNELAERAQGDVGDANASAAAHVAGGAHGTVRLRDAMLQFPAVYVTAPGAQVRLHGSYSLISTAFTLDGDVHTEAQLSHMTRGIKSLILRPFNRVLAHGDRGGATLPLHIHGSGSTLNLTTKVAGFRVKPPT